MLLVLKMGEGGHESKKTGGFQKLEKARKQVLSRDAGKEYSSADTLNLA